MELAWSGNVRLVRHHHHTFCVMAIFHFWHTPRFKLLLKAPNNTNDGDDEGDSESIIRNNALEKGVLALPGTVFLPNGRKTAYVRASFSLLSEADVDEAVRRLKEVILEARRDLWMWYVNWEDACRPNWPALPDVLRDVQEAMQHCRAGTESAFFILIIISTGFATNEINYQIEKSGIILATSFLIWPSWLLA
jgi:hypothetical protein